MWLSRSVVPFLSIVLAFVATTLEGGSLAPYPLLGTITNVHLAVSGGDLGYEPISGLDRGVLVDRMKRRVEKGLGIAGLKIAEPVDAYFLVTVDHAWDRQARDLVALLVTVELDVLAEPVELASKALMHGRPTLALWSDRSLHLTQSANAETVILEALDSALERLQEDRRSAQARTASTQ